MIIFRNLPIRWWLPAIAIYSIRVGFALDTGTSLVGFYVDHLGWQWLYWQGVVIAPLMGLMVYLGTPREAGQPGGARGMPTGAACCCSAPAFR